MRRARVARARPAAIALLVAFAVACAWTPLAPRAIGRCPGPLVATQDIDGEFVLQHQLRVVAEGVDFPFQTVLQKQQDEIVFIGMNALGVKLFTATQHGTDTEVDALPAAALPISPENLLRDMHRVLFLRAGTANERASSREREVDVLAPGDTDLARFRVEHPRCGYTLEVDTISEHSLPSQTGVDPTA